jgi:hypothetical protein
MKVFFTALFMCFFLTAFSQYTTVPLDRIYINDSSTVYEGLIVEQAPAKYVKIARRKEKDTIQVFMKDIWKMLRIYPVQDTIKKQEESKKIKKIQAKNKFVFLEALGSGGAYSINYDFRFNREIADKWGLRTGVEYLNIKTVNFSGDKLSYATLLFPFMVNYLAGKKNGFFELGLGAVYVIKWKQGKLLAQEYEYFIPYLGRRIPNVYGTVSAGYRHQSVKGKILWGISITPLIGNSFIIPGIGFKIGYRVK